MGRNDPVAGEIYIEFNRIGNQVRVTAIDAETGTEVFVLGPLNAAQNDLQNLAVRKLKRRLAQEQPEPLYPRGRGTVV